MLAVESLKTCSNSPLSIRCRRGASSQLPIMLSQPPLNVSRHAYIRLSRCITSTHSFQNVRFPVGSRPMLPLRFLNNTALLRVGPGDRTSKRFTEPLSNFAGRLLQVQGSRFQRSLQIHTTEVFPTQRSNLGGVILKFILVFPPMKYSIDTITSDDDP